MDNNRFFRLFLLFFFCLSLCTKLALGSISEHSDARVLKCIERERQALLKFKHGLVDDHALLSSWGSGEDNKECCKWWGVKCSNRIGHIIVLDLHSPDYRYLTGKLSHSLTELQHLSYLDLSYNNFSESQMGEVIGSLHRLKYLNLGSAGVTGVVPYQFSNLSSLQTLDLGYNNLTTDNLEWLSQLRSLRQLDLSGVYLNVTNWLQVMVNLPFLEKLHLNDCGLGHAIPFSLLLPSNLTVLSSLRELCLRNNNLSGRISESIGQLSKLEILDISSNSFEGTVSKVHFSRLSNLKELYLSFNSLTLNISSSWVPSFQLDVIKLANCSIGPHFPKWLKTQNNFSDLDLSSTGISDTLPNWFWDLSPKLEYLNLSYNQISGKLPELSNKFHGYPRIDLSSNNFSGPILSIPPNLTSLHLNNNMFVGSISFLCANIGDIFSSLDLSDNKFSGDLIPNCWMNMKELVILNLGNNSFSGQIPKSLGVLHHVQTLHLRDNSLVGEFPSSLKDCKQLKVIDVGRNNITGQIPAWIGTHLTGLVILSLRSNKFYGNIPHELCHLSHLQILDLSHNNITEKIPHCLYNLTSMVQQNVSSSTTTFAYPGGVYIDSILMKYKGRESKYRNTLGYVKLIDLSSNKLDGQIPQEIASLRGLISLNLSHNHLTGGIIEHIAQMEMLESLDLSKNKLSGEIPTGLDKLSLLGFLDLSYNDLSGRIPSTGQLATFDSSSYIENSDLCGPPVSMSCSLDTLDPQPSYHEKSNNVQNKDELITDEFYISMIFGFLFGLWGVFVILLKGSWRNAYFRFLEKTSDWLYVTSRVYMATLRRKLGG